MGIVRKTKSVKAVLSVFEEAKEALSAIQLIERFQHQMNKTTVYRVLKRLEDDGLLHSFIGKDGVRWYSLLSGEVPSDDSGSHTYSHFQCRDCGKTEYLTMSVSIPSVPNHKVDSAELSLMGQCEDCIS